MKETLSRYEWSIMEVLWHRNPLFMSDIIEAMETSADWNRSTFQTYLKRMVDKGYVGYTVIRGSRNYFPLIQRADCVDSESNAVLNKLTEQSAKMFLASMIQKSGLTSADRAELQALIMSLGNDPDEE